MKVLNPVVKSTGKHLLIWFDDLKQVEVDLWTEQLSVKDSYIGSHKLSRTFHLLWAPFFHFISSTVFSQFSRIRPTVKCVLVNILYSMQLSAEAFTAMEPEIKLHGFMNAFEVALYPGVSMFNSKRWITLVENNKKMRRIKHDFRFFDVPICGS